jgi:hypothetical protein
MQSLHGLDVHAESLEHTSRLADLHETSVCLCQHPAPVGLLGCTAITEGLAKLSGQKKRVKMGPTSAVKASGCIGGKEEERRNKKGK